MYVTVSEYCHVIIHVISGCVLPYVDGPHAETHCFFIRLLFDVHWGYVPFRTELRIPFKF